MLTGIGGTLGVVAGFAGPFVLSRGRAKLLEVFPDMPTILPPEVLEIEPQIAPWSIVVSFVISVAVGFLFGMYPAYRAAGMDPIEALRHE